MAHCLEHELTVELYPAGTGKLKWVAVAHGEENLVVPSEEQTLAPGRSDIDSENRHHTSVTLV